METQNEKITKVSFIDTARNKFDIEINITYRNGYKELSICGDSGLGSGQCQDEIQPANEPQKSLLQMWSLYHLKDVSGMGIEDRIEIIVSGIEDAEEERKGESLKDMSENNLIEMIERETDFSDRDAELCAAIIYMFDLCENDLQDIEINGTDCKIQGVDYRAGNDDEMDDLWDESLESYLDECVLPDLPETAQRYFDSESWKRDARMDGRGHSLNYYDGGEESRLVNGTWYYAYRN